MKQITRAGLGLALALTTACSAQRLDKDGVNEVLLEREFARVLRYDCAGALSSDKVEEVSEPSRWLEIVAEESFVVDHAKVTHEARPSDGGSMQYQGSSARFLIHFSNTWLGIRVDEGLNNFDYALFDAAGDEREAGRLQVKVEYRERKLDETREIRPSPESCESEEVEP
jgi:hypothetical protein